MREKILDKVWINFSAESLGPHLQISCTFFSNRFAGNIYNIENELNNNGNYFFFRGAHSESVNTRHFILSTNTTAVSVFPFRMSVRLLRYSIYNGPLLAKGCHLWLKRFFNELHLQSYASIRIMPSCEIISFFFFYAINIIITMEAVSKAWLHHYHKWWIHAYLHISTNTYTVPYLCLHIHFQMNTYPYLWIYESISIF